MSLENKKEVRDRRISMCCHTGTSAGDFPSLLSSLRPHTTTRQNPAIMYSHPTSQGRPSGATPLSGFQENRAHENHGLRSMHENTLAFGMNRELEAHDGNIFGVGSMGDDGVFNRGIDSPLRQPRVSTRVCCTNSTQQDSSVHRALPITPVQQLGIYIPEIIH